jgi:hypothetical protein
MLSVAIPMMLFVDFFVNVGLFIYLLVKRYRDYLENKKL